MSHLLAIDAFIMEKLAASAPVTDIVEDRIVSGMVPQEGAGVDLPSVEPPYITFSLNAASNGLVMNSGADDVLYVSPSFMVKCVTRGESYVEGEVLSARIRRAMVGKVGTYVIDGTSYNVQGCTQETPVRYEETIDGVRYNHCGGLYRFYVS